MPDTIKSIGVACSAALISIFVATCCYAANADYAALPPFLTSSIKPNALLVMDFSGSMQYPAHTSYSQFYYHSSKVANVADRGEASEDYDSSKDYYGYFDSDSYYIYNENGTSKGYWEIATDNKGYSNKQIGDADCLSGNFLNFLVMSRTDVALKNLIGGKADCSAESYCILEPQGSRRWVTVNGINADCYVRPEDPENGSYEVKDIMISIENHRTDYDEINDLWQYENSTIGTFTNRYARVKIAAQDRQGIVQQNADRVRFGFIAYADSENDTAEEGEIKYGVHENNIDDLISRLEATVPYYSTHTGEAMQEAYRYLKQENMFSYNSDYQGKTTAVDPFYEQREDGLEPAFCRRNYVILISDGVWNGSDDPYEWAYKLHTEDLRETDSGGAADKFPGQQNAKVYSIFTFSNDIGGRRSMKTVAAFGNFTEIIDEDPDDDLVVQCTDSAPYDITIPDTGDSTDVSFPRTNCNPASGGTYDDCCAEWDRDGDGVPDSFFNVTDGQAMSTAMDQVFREIRQGTSSSTAVTAITSRNTTGSVISQAVFYPEKEFDDEKKIMWTGNIFSEWYLNAYIGGDLIQNIREDTNNNFILDVADDRILEYEIQHDSLLINAYNSGNDGKETDDLPETYYSIDEVANLINFGEKLKDRAASDRIIFGVTEDPDVVKPFTSANSADFDGLLGTTAADFPGCLVDSETIQYTDLINFIRGEEISGCRSRTVDTTGNVWKLGDIISSSPTSVNYGDYRMIYTGSNDGMLHAFKLGYLKHRNNEMHPTELCNSYDSCDRDQLGKEEWAFIPIDSMPYLRYLADPEYDHIYTVDMKPYIINTSNKTYLIGGMRLGGACGNGDVNPPSDIASDLSITPQVGLSAYFALDITDPLKPVYKWRFTHQDLGFTYSGPAYVKREDAEGNLKHFVVFGSGPTGYDGTSVQNLKFFVVDLATGDHLYTSPALNISNPGFSGRMYTDGLDVNLDGQTDFILFGYTSKADQVKADFWKMDGGIMKIYTGSATPSEWVSTKYVDSIGDPVTAPIKTMNCFYRPYLYFGSGRYFITDDDDGDDGNYLYGVPFTCDAQNDNCSTINRIDNASDLTCDEVVGGTASAAWRIPLRMKEGNFLRERCNTAPSTTNDNIVLFDTIRPTDVVCECGGKSRSWAVNCATGEGLDASDICAGLDDKGVYTIDPNKGFKYLVQLSGGDIQQPEREDFDGNTGATDDRTGVTGDEGGTLTDPFNKTTYWKQW